MSVDHLSMHRFSGDLNDTPFSYAYKTLAKDRKDRIFLNAAAASDQPT
ncbi:MAG: hypothetical protein U0T81_18820 [Saprospiraceae bacterium]